MLFAIILALTFISGLFLPWWFAVLIALVVAYFVKTNGSAFWSGFAGVGLAWLAFALLKSLPNNNVLATRMATLFHLPHWLYLLLVTVVIGGLLGGFAALTGKLVRKAVERPQSA